MDIKDAEKILESNHKFFDQDTMSANVREYVSIGVFSFFSLLGEVMLFVVEPVTVYNFIASLLSFIILSNLFI